MALAIQQPSASTLSELRDQIAKVAEKPDASNPLEGRPYIITNETQCGVARRILGANRDRPGVHIGVSCWENYNIMLASGSTHGILFDSSAQVVSLNDRTAQCIQACQDRTQFMEQFLKYSEEDADIPLVVDQDKDMARDNSPNRLRRELEDPTSWLGSDANYQAIRQMYLDRKIVHIQMDAADATAMKVIATWLEQNQFSCSTFYLSNVRDWILNAVVKKIATEHDIPLDDPEALIEIGTMIAPLVEKAFLEIIAPVLNPTTLVIDSGYGSPRSDADELCPQFVFPASSYLQGNWLNGYLKAKKAEPAPDKKNNST